MEDHILTGSSIRISGNNSIRPEEFESDGLFQTRTNTTENRPQNISETSRFQNNRPANIQTNLPVIHEHLPNQRGGDNNDYQSFGEEGIVRLNNNFSIDCSNPFTHENRCIRYTSRGIGGLSVLGALGGIGYLLYLLLKPNDPTPPVINDVDCLNKMDGQYDKLQPDQLLIDPNCNYATTSFFSDRGNYLIEQTVNNYIKPSRDFDKYTGRANSDEQYKIVETWLNDSINKFKGWAKIDFVGDGPDTTISQDISTDNKYYTSCSTLKKIMDKIIKNIENKKQQKLSPSEIKVISDRYITSVVNKTQLGKVERNFVIRELQISKPKKQFISKKI